MSQNNYLVIIMMEPDEIWTLKFRIFLCILCIIA